MIAAKSSSGNNRAAEQVLVHVYGSKTWRKAEKAKKRTAPHDYARFQASLAECESKQSVERRTTDASEVAVSHCVEPVDRETSGRY